MRVFLDANILFSAAKSQGAVRELLRLLHAGGHELHVDDYVVAEARRNLIAKGHDALTALDRMVASCRQSAAHPPEVGASTENLGWLPEKDRPVLAAAIRLRCDALVTGDRRHFGARFGTVVGGVAIHSPRSLAESWLR